MSWALILKGLMWFLRRIVGANTDPQVAAGAAVDRERQTQTERENDALKAAAADRAAGDADRLRRDSRAGEVHADPNDPINKDTNLDLRD